MVFFNSSTSNMPLFWTGK